jgi:hypothetical protein
MEASWTREASSPPTVRSADISAKGGLEVGVDAERVVVVHLGH